MERFCDLHTHSTYSDGTCTPEEILTQAEKSGLFAVALCDHNTVAGLPSFMKAAKSISVTAIPGIEISADYMGREVHILGLFIKPCHYSEITAFLEEMRINKERSNINLLYALKQKGIHLDYDEIKRISKGGHINRAVIAAEMVRKGYTVSVKDAFSQWLSPKIGLYIPPERMDALRVIRFLKSIGAATILAHPFLNLEEAELLPFLREGRKCGLDGIEVYYPLFNEEKTMRLKQIAENYHLCESGGSDFHGANKPDISLGSGKGNIAVPASLIDRLYECVNSMQL